MYVGVDACFVFVVDRCVGPLVCCVVRLFVVVCVVCCCCVVLFGLLLFVVFCHVLFLFWRDVFVLLCVSLLLLCAAATCLCVCCCCCVCWVLLFVKRKMCVVVFVLSGVLGHSAIVFVLCLVFVWLCCFVVARECRCCCVEC